jgi:predicted DsbA family dithiol-disulfide isomerase
MTSTATPTAIPVAPGTIVVFSDLTDPFAHVAVHRLFTARSRLGLDDKVRFDHHAFPIELLNSAPGTRHGSDSEVPVLGQLEPDAGWQIWQGPDYHYPNTILLALEAVQAVKAQSTGASEQYDRALRRAFWAESRPIHLHHELLAIASDTHGVDVDALDRALRDGTHRRAIFDDLATVRTGAVKMSPHLFLADGTEMTNPGIDVHWQGDWTKGFPVIDNDDASVIDTLVARAADL